MLAFITLVHAHLIHADIAGRLERRLDAAGRESGQATAEYALVLIVAATVALLLLTWAAKSGLFQKLFMKVLTTIISKVL